MIVGIGIDTTQIERVRKACGKNAFVARVFSEDERELLDLSRDNKRCYEMAAGNFAGKEAVTKALGCGLSGVELSEIEILREASGKPYIRLSGRAKALSNDLGADFFHISITNTELEATAMVIAEQRNIETGGV